MTETSMRHEQRLKRDPSPLILQAYGAPHIGADKANFHHHLAAHRAHTVMLVERGIIAAADGAAILRALRELEAAGVESVPVRPELNDLFTCTEVLLVKSLGDAVGGRLHTGRSRNDLFMGLERMAAREAVVGKAVVTVVQRAADRQITAELVNQIAVDLLGVRLGLTDAEVAEALDPRINVEVRSTRGGPAPSEVRRMTEARFALLEESRARHERRIEALRDADRRLRAATAVIEERRAG